MTKTARNGIVAAAVVAVVAVAAAPFVVKGLKKQPEKAADTSTTVAVTEQFTYPAEETTADIISDILETMDNQTQEAAPTTVIAQQQPTQPQAPVQQPTQPQAPAQQTTQKQTPAPAETTARSWKITKQEKTTKPEKTTKQEKTTAAPTQTGDTVNVQTVQSQLASGGVVSYLWNEEGQFYYVDDNPWQRNFGFNAIYDWAAATVVIYYDTWRACFAYDDLEWMIQGWKGQYGFLFIGGEIGVYTRTPGEAVVTATHYNCADDNHLINMEMSVYYDAHDGNGYKKMFTRTYYPHWWCTGFVDGHLADYKFNDRSCLILIARMTMYDQDMVDAFTTALAGCGFRYVGSTDQVSVASSDTYTIVGNDVYLSWKTIDQGYKTR
jgi:hypothetical protein